MFNYKQRSYFIIFLKNRAKIASQLLCEMNPDVIGDYLEEVITYAFS